VNALRPSLLALLPVLATAGCSLLDVGPEIEPQKNSCEAATDCGSDASCVATAHEESICVANGSQLGSVILEVQLTGGTGASYLFPGAVEFSGSEASGAREEPRARLAEVGRRDRSHARVRLRAVPRARWGGPRLGPLPPPHGRRDVPLRSDRGEPVRARRSQRRLLARGAAPANTTSTFSRPSRPRSAPSSPPPRLVKQVVAMGESLSWTPPEEAFALLTGNLIVPEGTSLEGWIVEIVDPTYGHVVSDRLTLGVEREQLNIFESGIRYYPTADPILRLRDPEGDLSVHWVLGALDLDSDGHVEIDLQDLVATPMPIEATIIDGANNFIPNANVVVQSLALTGSANQNATYRVATTSDAAGIITVNLVPGTYAISIVPQSEDLAPFIGTWEITADAGGSGLGFPLEGQPLVRSSVSDADGVPLAYAPIVVAPTQSSLNDYFSQVLRKPTPRRPGLLADAVSHGQHRRRGRVRARGRPGPRRSLRADARGERVSVVRLAELPG
jgi:hypothetical protein